jgi:teichuronic acid biosynthesis glycosyltransferase TuaC
MDSTLSSRLRVLHLSRNFPNPVFPRLGLWTERLVRSCLPFCDVKVVAPVPYCPPLGLGQFRHFREIEPHAYERGLEVFHPRFITGPGTSWHNFESSTYHLGVVRHIDRLRESFPFDLLHAHFTYPDGVVGARLARKYNVPLIITEHAAWQPWLDEYPIVRRKALWAARESQFIIAVSKSHRESILHFMRSPEKVRVIPNLVDGSVFRLPSNGNRVRANTILFVGITRKVKGLDILLKAIRLIVDSGRDVKLIIVGEGFYKAYQREYQVVEQMVRDLKLTDYVEFLGPKTPPEVAVQIQQSALLVLPSRRESFGAVLIEALACGTPVVATRCGGPEDIVNNSVGLLVEKEDPAALAQGIEQVLDRREEYEAAKLRDYALENFGAEKVSRRIADLYADAVANFRGTTSATPVASK